MSVFGPAYAGAYDALYGEKNYAAECDMIVALLAEFGRPDRAHGILDFGCGTGNHAIPLAQRGFQVTGVDLSSAMLALAREKAAAAGVSGRVEFYRADIREVSLTTGPFDAGLMMFAVLGYQQSDEDVRAALLAMRRHLARGAAFVFDVWYGPGVLSDRPGARERQVETAEGRIRRRTETSLDEQRHLCRVAFDLEYWRGQELEKTVQEEHVMRFFFPGELETFAAACGFHCAAILDFSDYRKPANAASWNAIGVFQAV